MDLSNKQRETLEGMALMGKPVVLEPERKEVAALLGGQLIIEAADPHGGGGHYFELTSNGRAHLDRSLLPTG